MELSLKRDTLTDASSIGRFYIDGVWHCFTLEDTMRAPGVKVPGQTAIPMGRYEVVIDWSDRFQKMMIHILNVPGFTGIRIHKGNKAVDTEGCVIVGATRGKDWIGNCSLVYDPLFKAVSLALQTEKVYIDVSVAEDAIDRRTQRDSLA